MTASRDWFNRRLTPLAQRMAGISPNAISVFALLTGVAAGVAYWQSARHPVLFLVGGILVAVSGIADGLDGVVARLHDRSSTWGDFLDHFFDRLVNIAIFVGLGLSANGDIRLALATTIVLLLNSYLGTQIHASFGERHYSGLGKAQLVVALAIGSALLSIYPDAAFTVIGRQLTAVNLCFCAVILLSLHGMGHRIRLARRLAD